MGPARFILKPGLIRAVRHRTLNLAMRVTPLAHYKGGHFGTAHDQNWRNNYFGLYFCVEGVYWANGTGRAFSRDF